MLEQSDKLGFNIITKVFWDKMKYLEQHYSNIGNFAFYITRHWLSKIFIAFVLFAFDKIYS